MATGDPKSLEDIVNCDICFEVMTRPQALNCLHHYCYDCTIKLTKIEKTGKNGVECPFCNRFTPKEDIQDSFVMNNLLDIYHRKEDQRKEDEEKAKKVVDAIEEKHDSEFCKFHPGYEIKYSCIPCQSAICLECKVESHDTHPTESVEKAFNAIIAQVDIQSAVVKKDKDELQQHLDEVKNQKIKSHSMYEATNKKILDHKGMVIAKIEADCNELLEGIQFEYDSKSKELDTAISDVENQLAGRERLLSWTNTITGMTAGPSPLCEIQGGLLQKLQKAAQAKALIPVTKHEMSFADFQPSRINIKENYVGMLIKNEGKQQQVERVITVEIPASQSQDSSVKPKVPPRKTQQQAKQASSVSLFSRAGREPTLADNLTLGKNSGFRLCYHNNQLWLPTCDNKSVDVYSIHGTLVRSVKSDQLKRPLSIHPVGDVNLVLTDANGLFLLDSQGKVIKRIMAGNMLDVHVDGSAVVALEEITCAQGKVHIFNTSNSPNVEKSFLLEKNPQSIMIVSGNIYVSFRSQDNAQYNDVICKYNMNGNKLAQYGKRGSGGPGELKTPLLSASDAEGSLLITDRSNRRLQVLDRNGQWSVMMAFPAYIKALIYAVFDGHQSIFVLCLDSQYQGQILKYTI